MLDTKIQQATAKSIVKSFLGSLANNLDSRINNIKFDFTDSSSNFNFEKQTIFINRNYVQDINVYVHEILHAISTKSFDNKVLIGFNKKEYTKLDNENYLETSFGYALNEGATHSLTIDATKDRFGEIVGTTHYNFCANIYKNLEKVVGKSLLSLCYLESGIDGFISIIAKTCHTNPQNVINLVTNMDAYFDTQRIYSLFLFQDNSQDAKSLLSNCYGYLKNIISDYCKFTKKKFDIFENIRSYNLSSKELFVFYETLKNVDNIKTTQNFTLKDYEKMSQYIFSNSNKKSCGIDILPEYLKLGEFLNYLLINNYIVDENRIRKDNVSFQIKSKLTKQIFDKNIHALKVDKNLPYNIRTLLSTRYVVRADTSVSDDYMKLCLYDKNFCDYLKNTDNDYYNLIAKDNRQTEL